MITRDEEIEHLKNLYEGFNRQERLFHLEPNSQITFDTGDLIPNYSINVTRDGDNVYQISAYGPSFQWQTSIVRDDNNFFNRPFWQHLCRKMQQIYLKDHPEALKLMEHINSCQDNLEEKETDRFSQLL